MANGNKWQRDYLRVRSRALTRLKLAHEEQYQQLMKEEWEREENNNGLLVGNSTAGVLVGSYKDATEGNSASDISKTQGNNGGEE